MRKKAVLLSLIMPGVILLTGCTANLADPEIEFEPPVYVEQMPAMEDQQDFVSTGSIFGQGDNPLFSDHKAMHVNDIVRVVISETANSSNVAQKTLARTDNSEMGGGLFSTGAQTAALGGATGLLGGSNEVNNAGRALNDISSIGFRTASNNAFTGNGQAVKNATFTTTISARIVKVLSNGNYFISGKREILIDNQKQIIQISGVIRPYDIDQTNKINSNQMSDAKILYKTEGDLDRATQQGWGTKLVQAVWPF